MKFVNPDFKPPNMKYTKETLSDNFLDTSFISYDYNMIGCTESTVSRYLDKWWRRLLGFLISIFRYIFKFVENLYLRIRFFITEFKDYKKLHNFIIYDWRDINYFILEDIAYYYNSTTKLFHNIETMDFSNIVRHIQIYGLDDKTLADKASRILSKPYTTRYTKVLNILSNLLDYSKHSFSRNNGDFTYHGIYTGKLDKEQQEYLQKVAINLNNFFKASANYMNDWYLNLEGSLGDKYDKGYRCKWKEYKVEFL